MELDPQARGKRQEEKGKNTKGKARQTEARGNRKEAKPWIGVRYNAISYTV